MSRIISTRAPRVLRRAIAVIAAVGTVSALAACSVNSGTDPAADSSSSDNTSAPTSAGSSSESAAETSEDAADQRVVIGVALPFSGTVARTGNLYRHGVELRLKQAEEAGELGNIKVEVDYQDDGNDPNQGVTLVSRFDQAGAVAMIGAHSSPVALAQAQAVETAKLPEFVFGASNLIDNPYQYQADARDSEQIKNVLAFAKAKGYTTVGLMTDTGAYGTSALDQLTKVLDGSALTVVGSETFEPSASNLTPQLLSMQKANPDFIAMFSFGSPYAAVVQARAEVGWDVDIVGNVAAGDVAIGDIAKSDATGLYYQTPLDTGSAAGKELLADWETNFPDAPLTFEGAIAYDATTILIRALLEGGTTREAVQDWLTKATSVDGLVCGKAAWDVASRHGLKSTDLTFRVWENGSTVAADLG